MVTAARHTAWLLGGAALLLVPLLLSNVWIGSPSLFFEGRPVRTPEQTLRALAFLGLLILGCAGVLAITWPSLVERSRGYSAVLARLDAEPIWPVVRIRSYYLASLLIGLVVMARSGVPIGELAPLLVALPMMFPVGWAMAWPVLGIQLINPLMWIFPQLLREVAYLFLVLSTGWIIWLLLDVRLSTARPEAGLAAANLAGCAVGTGRFLRFWLRRALGIEGPPSASLHLRVGP